MKLKKTKLTRGKFKAFLVNRYEGVIAEKIVRIFGDAFKLNQEGTLTFDEYCNFFSELINHQPKQLFNLAFKIYDFNSNEQICELDLISLLKTQENFELVKIYIQDINLVINALQSKTQFKGCVNRDIDVALAAIYKRAGVEKEFNVGDINNPNQPPILVQTPIRKNKKVIEDEISDADSGASRNNKTRYSKFDV